MNQKNWNTWDQYLKIEEQITSKRNYSILDKFELNDLQESLRQKKQELRKVLFFTEFAEFSFDNRFRILLNWSLIVASFVWLYIFISLVVTIVEFIFGIFNFTLNNLEWIFWAIIIIGILFWASWWGWKSSNKERRALNSQYRTEFLRLSADGRKPNMTKEEYVKMRRDQE